MTAALGYSRKVLYADAMAMCQARAELVLQKPQGKDGQAIALAILEAVTAYAAVNQRLVRLAAALARLDGTGGGRLAGRALAELAPAAGLGLADLALLAVLAAWLEVV
ncbi:hypothetical protein DFAR_3840007 [Desulfarculales bacterium]